eukprot:12714453-Ditylum_brightwellii.AAC.1
MQNEQQAEAVFGLGEVCFILLRQGINACPWSLSFALRPWVPGHRIQGRTDTGLTRHHPIGCCC